MHPPPPTRTRPLSILLAVLVGFVVGALLTGAVSVVGRLPRTSVEARYRQPAAVHYADGSIHWVLVVRRRAIGSPVVGDDFTELRIGRDPSGSYAHGVRLSATGADLRHLRVEWRPDAVVVRLTSGHELRVPAKAFTGGR